MQFQKKIRRFFFTDDAQLSFRAVFILFILLLLPILVLGFYSVPSADDYGCGAYVHLAWKETHSPLAVLTAIFRQASHFYNTWQGTFGSSVMMSLDPAFFNIHLSFLVPVLLLFLSTISAMLLCHEIAAHYLGYKGKAMDTSVLLLMSVLFQTFVSSRDGLFWYNGAIHYMGMQSLFFLSLYFSSRLYRTQATWAKLLLTILLLALCLLTGGANLVTALQAVLVYTLLLFCGLFMKRKHCLRLLLPACFLYAGFFINVLAPGNRVRGNSFTSSNPLTAILRSFLSAGNYLIQWMNPLFILALLILLPLLWRMVSDCSASFKHPLLLLAVSVCLYSAMFTPSLYATGSVGADRQLNMIQWTLYLLILWNLTYFLGYLSVHKTQHPAPVLCLDKVVSPGTYFLTVFGFSAMAFVLLFTVDRTTYTSIAAARILANGEAATYHSEYMERYQTLEESDTEDASVTPFTVYPELLTSPEDFSEDIMDWLNITGSRYFGKKTITMKSCK